MIARILIAFVAACAVNSILAQTPTWNAPDGRNSSLPKQQPSGVVRNAGNSTAAAANALQPPRDRDCKATITNPVDRYAPKPTRFNTDGTEDHGHILNAIGQAVTGVADYLNDVQVRIEQLRCEQDNIKAKLDFLIRINVR